MTFDDGYLDNLTNAKPILEEHDVPATIFVCSGAVGRRQEFWWDQLERALLRSPKKLPERLELDIDGKRMTWRLEEDDRLSDDHDWRARPPLPHAVSRLLHSFSGSIFRYLLLDHVLPAMCLNLVPAKLRALQSLLARSRDASLA